MLNQSLRNAILELHEKGHGKRTIARALKISRGTVKAVLDQGSAEVPKIERAEKAEPYREQILELHKRCGGNLVRVHEELQDSGAELPYQTLTAGVMRNSCSYWKNHTFFIDAYPFKKIRQIY
jgi:hypothetical protein